MTDINNIVLEALNNVPIGSGPGPIPIPDGSGPPPHGRGQGPGKGKKDGTGLKKLIQINKQKEVEND